MQATAVDAMGGNAGTFSNPSNNTQLEECKGVTFLSTTPASTNNTFSVDWTAPAMGGDVIYASGLAAGGSGSSGG